MVDLDLRVILETLETLELRAHLVTQATLELMGPQVRRERQEMLESLETLELRARLVTQGTLESTGRLDLVASVEMLVLTVIQVAKDLQVILETLET